MNTVLVTGSRGFIGSNFIRMLHHTYPKARIIEVDSLTYAGRPRLVELRRGDVFVQADIRDKALVKAIMRNYKPDTVFHFAAESHVCRSIEDPSAFIDTNVVGTYNLIDAWKDICPRIRRRKRFIHISTDEVFGELGKHGKFSETTAIRPRSPYAASKAGSDHIVMSYAATYNVCGIVTNCTNNFGINQHPEKLVPRTILRILSGMPVIVHGMGDHIRDWIHVDDHNAALLNVYERGVQGHRYCIGGEKELTNNEMINLIYAATKVVYGKHIKLDLKFTRDRPTDDFRYAVDTKLIRSLGWKPATKDFFNNMIDTVQWYGNQLATKKILPT